MMTHASVFSGIGGPEVAATMLGWTNLFHCEINPFGRKVLQYWYPNSKSYEDITTTDFTEWRGRVNVLTGGFPCQPFSYAGKRKGADDDRYLWPHMHRCINEVQPDWVVCENVGGILTMVEQGEVSQVASQATMFDEGDAVRRYRLTETFTLERISTDLEADGYEVQSVLVPACAVGAPHRRDRVFIIGHRLTPSANTACGGERASRQGGEPESSGRDTHQQPSEWGAASEWNNRFYAILRDATHTDGIGHSTPKRQSGRKRTEMDNERCNESLHGIARHGNERFVTDTYSHRGCEVDEHMESQQPDGSEPIGNGREWDASDTIGRGVSRLSVDESQCDEGIIGQSEQGDESDGEQHQQRRFAASTDTSSERPQARYRGRETCEESRNASSGNARSDSEYSNIAGLGRWATFPSVSPVHRGNDGIPFALDNLTISQGKWRTESLKAYGNAIVPQVMYEIFRAIEVVSSDHGRVEI